MAQKANRSSRTTQINLRLTKPEKATLRLHAARAGLSLSAFLIAAGLRRSGATDGDDAHGTPDFTERDDDSPKLQSPSPHMANLKHLLSWAQVLEQREVDTGDFREILKLHLAQAEAHELWKDRARKLGRELVLATKLGAHPPVLRKMTDTIIHELRQHLEPKNRAGAKQ